MDESLINNLVQGREEELIELFLVQGPAGVSDFLELNKEQWEVVFKYFVQEWDLLLLCVQNNCSFFLENYVEHGFSRVRKILNVSKNSFDDSLGDVFHLLAIENGGIYRHVLNHRERYADVVRKRGGDFVRKILGLWDEQYNEHWEQVLDLLLHSFCENMIMESGLDYGLHSFSNLLNSMREHKKPFRSGLFIN